MRKKDNGHIGQCNVTRDREKNRVEWINLNSM